MNTSNWNYYFKLDHDGSDCMAQQTYEPLINPEGNVFCKNYNIDNSYQYLEISDRPLYTKEAVDWFFLNELTYLEYFKDHPYAPEVIDIDYVEQKIFLRWYGRSCNQMIYSGESWPEADWREQIKNIVVDQYDQGVYKLTMYPHCHYIDNHGQMRAIDWYGCVPIDEPFVDEKYMNAIIHETAKFRLDELGALVNNKFNLEEMFKRSLGEHVFWGDKNMRYIYKEIFSG